MAVADMNHILSDEEFMLGLLLDEEKDIAKQWKINSYGDLIIGKYKYDFLNKLLGAERTIAFESLMIRLIRYLSGHKQNKNELALKGMSEDFTNEIFHQNRRDEVVEMVFSYYRFGRNTGYFDNPEQFQSWISANGQKSSPQNFTSGVGFRDSSGQIAILLPDLKQFNL